jgi:uncharacterized SAM-binding protein YcdF (DUF218 family)
VGCGLLAAAAAWAVPRAGAFLIVQDAFDRAEVALVLSGGPVARTLAARDLYRQGRVSRIAIIPEPPDPAGEELVKLGLVDPAHPFSERILTASGVPQDRIAFLPRPAEGTIDEARLSRAFFQGRWPRTLVLITSKSATRRARFIFRRVCRNEPVAILAHPTPYDPFEPRRWWTHPRHALHVVMEYQKFFINALTLLFGAAWEALARSGRFL